MEIRGTAWTTGDLEQVSAIEVVTNLIWATDPIGAIKSAEGHLIEQLTKERAVQRSLITYSMGPGEFDLIVESVKEKALKEGRKEAWDLARRIVISGPNCYAIDEVNKVFGGNMNIFNTPVEEVLAKDKKYQEEKKALHIGDEVKFDNRGKRITGYVTNLIQPAQVRVLTKEHGTFTVVFSNCIKTGKHSDEIEKAMDSFEEGECG